MNYDSVKKYLFLKKNAQLISLHFFTEEKSEKRLFFQLICFLGNTAIQNAVLISLDSKRLLSTYYPLFNTRGIIL